MVKQHAQLGWSVDISKIPHAYSYSAILRVCREWHGRITFEPHDVSADSIKGTLIIVWSVGVVATQATAQAFWQAVRQALDNQVVYERASK